MDESTRRQAAHFDQHVPISPWPEIVRRAGFKFHYIAKDLVIKDALDGVNPASQARALDIGCGIGVLLDRLESSYGVTGFGVDISPRSLEAARLQSVGRSSYALADARALPFADGTFDVITSLDVLEHIEQADRALLEMARVVSPQGAVLVYAVSRRNSYTYQWFEKSIAKVFGIDLHRFFCHSPDLLVDPELVIRILGKDGVELKAIQYFHAFFTSLFDRSLLLGYLLLKKLGLLQGDSVLHRLLGKLILPFATVASRLALRPLLWLDRPWLRRGYANGFLAVARKLG